jgi:hypothetical protein
MVGCADLSPSWLAMVAGRLVKLGRPFSLALSIGAVPAGCCPLLHDLLWFSGGTRAPGRDDVAAVGFSLELSLAA